MVYIGMVVVFGEGERLLDRWIDREREIVADHLISSFKMEL